MAVGEERPAQHGFIYVYLIYVYSTKSCPPPLRPTPQWVNFGASGKLSTPWADGTWGGASSAARLCIYIYVNV